MKVAFTILFVFLISFALRSEAREMNFQEKTVLLNLNKTLKVKSYMINHIDLPSLPLSQYLSYRVLKNSCSPLLSQIDRIKNANDSYEDQSKKLLALYAICTNAVIGLSEMFISHQE